MTGARMKTVAIHQPNFFPWLGYFNKIIRSDVFIVLDHVQFPKTGGTWINRVKMLVGGRPSWVTVPITRNFHGVKSIGDMEINETTPWREKLEKTLQANYAGAPYFKEVMSWVRPLIHYPTSNLCQLNLHAIGAMVHALEIPASRLVLSSTLKSSGQATDLLVSLIQAVDGTAYLCGHGAGGYQEDGKFGQNGIQLIQQGFAHPAYRQVATGEFHPGLSILDCVMNVGFEKAKVLVQAGDGSLA